MRDWWNKHKPIFKTARFGKTKIWYSRTGPSFPNSKRQHRWKEHHILSLTHIVNKEGSFYRVNLMRWSVLFGFKPKRGSLKVNVLEKRKGIEQENPPFIQEYFIALAKETGEAKMVYVKGEERKEELLKSLQEEGWEVKFQYFTLRLHGKDVWCW